MGHRDFDAFLIGFDSLFAIARLSVRTREDAVGVAFVVGFGEIVFEKFDHIAVLAELFVFLGEPKHDHCVIRLGLEHLAENFDTVLHMSKIFNAKPQSRKAAKI